MLEAVYALQNLSPNNTGQGDSSVKVLLYKREFRFPIISVQRRGKAHPVPGSWGRKSLWPASSYG